MLQDLDCDHLPILLSVPLAPVFRSNERPSSFNIQKARWDDFAFYFDSHCPSAEEHSSLSLSFATALFTSLALKAAKYLIPFGRIKRHSKAWWSAKVEEAVSERRKAFAYSSAEGQCTHFFALLLVLPPLLTSQTVPLPGNRFRSTSLPRDHDVLSLSQRPCVGELEATFLSSSEPRALRSLSRPSVLPSLPLSFLRLSPTFPSSLPLAQIKSPIPC